MIKLLKDDTRSAVVFLNYANSVAPDPLTPMGPNAMGEDLWPVALSEDGKRIGFSFIAPGEDA